MSMKLPASIPDNLGKAIDLYYKVRQHRLDEQHKVDEIQEFEKQLKEHLIANIPKSQLTGVSGKTARCTIVEKETARVEDWDVFYKYISRTKSFDLLNRAVNNKAVKERWDAKKKVPGVGVFKFRDISVNKV